MHAVLSRVYAAATGEGSAGSSFSPLSSLAAAASSGPPLPEFVSLPLGLGPGARGPTAAKAEAARRSLAGETLCVRNTPDFRRRLGEVVARPAFQVCAGFMANSKRERGGRAFVCVRVCACVCVCNQHSRGRCK